MTMILVEMTKGALLVGERQGSVVSVRTLSPLLGKKVLAAMRAGQASPWAVCVDMRGGGTIKDGMDAIYAHSQALPPDHVVLEDGVITVDGRRIDLRDALRRADDAWEGAVYAPISGQPIAVGV